LYDKYKAGIFYACKEGLINEDWDILFNDEKEKAKLLALGG